MVSFMLSRPKSYRVLVGVLAAIWAASTFLALSQTQSQGSRKKDAKPTLVSGRQTFVSTCANCHGLDGRGGERAPNIAERLRVQQLSDAQLFKIIENGIPGTGMPAFHSLENSNIEAVVTYLRTLQGTGQPVKLPGDPGRGQTIFLGKAGCSGCHMVDGKGGFIASDLSAYARTHTAEQIRNEITTPPNNDYRVRTATATIRSGERYTGRVRNEDNFSVQLQALDGIFHFFLKSEIEGLEYGSQSLMPSNFGSTLSPDELNDVVSYLMSLVDASTRPSKTPEKGFEEE
ncbi:MAG: c-type cytochrome [Candidatus Sulfotelmatobacter sp.]